MTTMSTTPSEKDVNNLTQFYYSISGITNEVVVINSMIEELKPIRDRLSFEGAYPQESETYSTKLRIFLSHIILCSRKISELLKKTILDDRDKSYMRYCPKFYEEALPIKNLLLSQDLHETDLKIYRNKHLVHPFKNSNSNNLLGCKDLFKTSSKILDGATTLDDVLIRFNNDIYPLSSIEVSIITLRNELEKLNINVVNIEL